MPTPQFDNPNAGLYWGVVEGAARAGANTQQVWEAIRQHAATLGLESPGITAQDVSRLRGEAGGIIRAGNRLERARPDQGITSDLISRPYFGRTEDRQNAAAMYQVRFQHTVEANGEQQTLWRTVTFRGALPATVGGLADLVEQDAAEMAEGYGQTHLGIESMQLMAV